MYLSDVCVPHAALHVTAFCNQAGRIQTLSFLFVVVICIVGGFFISFAFHIKHCITDGINLRLGTC